MEDGKAGGAEYFNGQSPRETATIWPMFGSHSLNGKIGWGY
jgi:hypothetical protein